MNINEIIKFIEPILKSYGFKRDRYTILFHLDDTIELRVETGNTVGNKIMKFELSDMSKREPGYHWGGYVSELKLDHSFDKNILCSTFTAWLNSIFELEEMQPYARSLKIKKIKKTAG